MIGDLANREERPPLVRFEKRAFEDKEATRREGHVVFKDIDIALITPRYSKDLVEIKVETWLENQERYAKNNQIPREWLELYKKAYKKWRQGEELPLNGTPIKGWQALTPAQTKTILGAGILTIEDLAGCNDEGLRRLGMGGRDLINRAKSWLKTANDTGKTAMQNAALEKENEYLKTTVSSLEEKVMILSQKVDQLSKSGPVSYEPEQVSPITAADILEDYEPTEGPISRAELNRMYREKFNRKANVRMTDESIKQKLGL